MGAVANLPTSLGACFQGDNICPWEASWDSRQCGPSPGTNPPAHCPGRKRKWPGGAGRGPGAEAGKAPWPLLRERRQSSLSLPTLGWVWRPMGGVGFGERGASSCPPHSSGAGTLRSGASVGKGPCSSTSSILYSLHSTPSLGAGNMGYPFGTALRMLEGPLLPTWGRQGLALTFTHWWGRGVAEHMISPPKM